MTSGLVSWFDATSFTASPSVAWTDKSGNGRNAGFPSATDITLRSDAAGSGHGNSVAMSYVSGTTLSQIIFGGTLSAYPMTLCTVTRYTGTNKKRIVTSTSSSNNWMVGQHGGDEGSGPTLGIAYFSGAWVQQTTPSYITSLSGSDTNWVYECVSISNAKLVILWDNGRQTQSGTYSGIGGYAPTPLTINLYESEQSDFGVAEFILWDRALSSSDLSDMQAYLSSKYGFDAPCSLLPSGLQPAYKLGSYYQTNLGGVPGFPDTSANWIWYNTQGSLNTGLVVYFFATINVQAPTSAVAYYIADDIAALTVNGIALGGWSNGNDGHIGQQYFTLNTGNNYIQLAAQNTGGGAALLAAICGASGACSGQNVILDTSSLSSWAWSMNPSTTCQAPVR